MDDQFKKFWATFASIVGAVLLVFQLAQAFTGNRTLVTGLLIMISFIAIGVGMWNYAFAKSTIDGIPRYPLHQLAKIALVLIFVSTMISGIYNLTILGVVPDCCGFVTTLASLSLTPTLSSTPFPRGNLFLNIDFNEKPNGFCNDYDLNILGYESLQYYIQSLSTAGYISHCLSVIWDSI